MIAIIMTNNLKLCNGGCECVCVLIKCTLVEYASLIIVFYPYWTQARGAALRWRQTSPHPILVPNQTNRLRPNFI